MGQALLAYGLTALATGWLVWSLAIPKAAPSKPKSDCQCGGRCSPDSKT